MDSKTVAWTSEIEPVDKVFDPSGLYSRSNIITRSMHQFFLGGVVICIMWNSTNGGS